MNQTDKYTLTVGLEIHAEMKTDSKMFCSCKNNPDEEVPNTNICPVCTGHPGTLPVLNMKAIENVLRIGMAVNGDLADFTEWDRKNYFYPDIPKGYQISQYKYPLVKNGEIGGVSIERIHLEEDTASSTHDTHENSLVNFNRSGVPLMELVTKPVIHDAKTAVTFAKELQLILRYLDIGKANMEKGEMRVEANISVARKDDPSLGTKTEVKNLNSFRSVERAIEYEQARQIALLESGGKVLQETRGWDDGSQKTFSQRSKESSHDYRYFPDPDIPKLKISMIKELDREILEKSIPELPQEKRIRYKNDYAMTDKEVSVFVESPVVSEYFEKVITPFATDSKKIRLGVNYILTDYLGLIKKSGKENNGYSSINKISPTNFSELIIMAEKGDLSSRGAKDILTFMYDDPSLTPQELASKHGLIQKSDTSDLLPIIDKILSDHGEVVKEYKNGKLASLQFLIGQAMKATKGSANPGMVKNLIEERLSK